MKTFLILIVFLSFNFFGSAQNVDAVQTVKEIYTKIQLKKFGEIINKFDETEKEKVSNKFLKEIYDFIADKEIDFQNPLKIITTNLDAEATITIYRFRFLNSEPGNFFEIGFSEKDDLNKVVSIDILKIKKIDNFQVINPIWDNVPEPGQVIVENYSNSEKIQWIKFKNESYYVVIELDKKSQNKFLETFYSNDDPLLKKIIIYYPTGNIKRIAHYYNSFAVGLFQEFYENGFLAKIGKYNTENQKTGKWIFYNDEGEIIKSENYDGGVPDLLTR